MADRNRYPEMPGELEPTARAPFEGLDRIGPDCGCPAEPYRHRHFLDEDGTERGKVTDRDAETRQAIAAALRALYGGMLTGNDDTPQAWLDDANTLMPVVGRLVAEAERRGAVGALESAARQFDDMASPTLHGDPFIRASDWAARIIRERAAIATGSPESAEQPGSGTRTPHDD